ncbi:MAG: hypothetical protein LC118_21285 [Dehalococcoidia bacterium]|nr:hypothetical protein [Dehalococcoidia bacterium]
MRRLEVRLLPASQLIGYLVRDLGGADHGDGTVTGEGWTARFIEGEPATGHHARIPVLFIEFEGPSEETATSFMMRMTMRGGG